MYETTPECPKAAETGRPNSGVEAPLSLSLSASRRLRQLLALTLCAFAALPTFTVLPHLPSQPGWLLLLLCFWALVGLGWRELRAWTRDFPHRLSWHSGALWLECASGGIGSVQSVERVGEALVWSWLLVVPLRLNTTGKRYILVCLPDSAERDALRRLRVGLRTGHL